MNNHEQQLDGNDTESLPVIETTTSATTARPHARKIVGIGAAGLLVAGVLGVAAHRSGIAEAAPANVPANASANQLLNAPSPAEDTTPDTEAPGATPDTTPDTEVPDTEVPDTTPDTTPDTEVPEDEPVDVASSLPDAEDEDHEDPYIGEDISYNEELGRWVDADGVPLNESYWDAKLCAWVDPRYPDVEPEVLPCNDPAEEIAAAENYEDPYIGEDISYNEELGRWVDADGVPLNEPYWDEEAGEWANVPEEEQPKEIYNEELGRWVDADGVPLNEPYWDEEAGEWANVPEEEQPDAFYSDELDTWVDADGNPLDESFEE